jgi:hypothetical protein
MMWSIRDSWVILVVAVLLFVGDDQLLRQRQDTVRDPDLPVDLLLSEDQVVAGDTVFVNASG